MNNKIMSTTLSADEQKVLEEFREKFTTRPFGKGARRIFVMDDPWIVSHVCDFILSAIRQAKEEGRKEATFDLIAVFHTVLKDLYGVEIADMVMSRVNDIYVKFKAALTQKEKA